MIFQIVQTFVIAIFQKLKILYWNMDWDIIIMFFLQSYKFRARLWSFDVFSKPKNYRKLNNNIRKLDKNNRLPKMFIRQKISNFVKWSAFCKTQGT